MKVKISSLLFALLFTALLWGAVPRRVMNVIVCETGSRPLQGTYTVTQNDINLGYREARIVNEGTVSQYKTYEVKKNGVIVSSGNMPLVPTVYSIKAGDTFTIKVDFPYVNPFDDDIECGGVGLDLEKPID